MNNIFYLYFLGPLILCALYALCFFLVIGVKVVLYFLLPKKTKPQKETPKKTIISKQKKRNNIKCIEIDPDFIDRIYVKKSS